MNAARLGDSILQDAPHCHAPIHPAAPSPTPAPHPAMPLTIIKGEPTVMIGNMPAARVMDMSQPCMLASCVPGGPGNIAKGSADSSQTPKPGVAGEIMGSGKRHRRWRREPGTDLDLRTRSDPVGLGIGLH